MDDDVGDGMVMDLRGVDMASLLNDAAGAAVRTALDRLLISNASGNNGFNNSIDLPHKPPGKLGILWHVCIAGYGRAARLAGGV